MNQNHKKNWMSYSIALVLLISLINLAFNFQFINKLNQQEPVLTKSNSGVAVRQNSEDSLDDTQKTEASDPSTNSGTLLGTIATDSTEINNNTNQPNNTTQVSLNPVFKTENSQFCQWTTPNSNVAAALLTPDKQLVTLTVVSSASTIKFYNTPLVGYLWNPDTLEGYRYEQKDFSTFHEYVTSNLAGTDYIEMWNLITSNQQLECQPSEVDPESMRLPSKVQFTTIPLQE